jgi:3-oxoacyl-[acyl-carrier-protein] synthase-1
MTQAVIVGVGARSPLGLNATQTAFSLRVGLPAMREAPLVDSEGERITMCFLPTIDPHLTGPARGFELAQPALAEALRPISGLKTLPLRVRMALAVDEYVDAMTAASLVNRLDDPIKLFAAEFEQTISTRGPAGGAYLLHDILEGFAANRFDLAILGGIHTDYDPARIAELDRTKRLFCPPADLAAVLPGEAAAFVMLVQPLLARRMGWEVFAGIVGVATGFEQARPDNDASAFRATGLTAAMRTVLAPLDDQKLRAGWVLSDLGFEPYRHFEQQAALTRTQRWFCEPQQLDNPAQRMGNLGAATVPLHLAIACKGFEHACAPHHVVLSTAGSDGGERAATVIVRAS